MHSLPPYTKVVATVAHQIHTEEPAEDERI
jgi:hypothetical protein